MGSKEIILTAALVLFNQNGAVQSTTNHIAKAAEISPGNLYYHFKNKEQIVRELFCLHLKEIENIWSFENGITPKSVAEAFASLAKSQYNYRFFYRDITTLLAADPDLVCLYHQNKAGKIAMLNKLAQKMVADGLFEMDNQPDNWTVFYEMLFFSNDYWLARTFCEEGFKNLSPEKHLEESWQNNKILYTGYVNQSGKQFLANISKEIHTIIKSEETPIKASFHT